MLSKKGQRRLFVLQDTTLEWFDVQAVTDPDALAKGRIDVASCTLSPGANDKSFVLQASDGTAAFELKAETANEARAWIHVIGKVVEMAAAARGGASDGSGGGGVLGSGEPPMRKGMLVVRGKARYCVLMRGYFMWMESAKKIDLLGTMSLTGAAVQRNLDNEATFSITANAGGELVDMAAKDPKEGICHFWL